MFHGLSFSSRVMKIKQYLPTNILFVRSAVLLVLLLSLWLQMLWGRFQWQTWPTTEQNYIQFNPYTSNALSSYRLADSSTCRPPTVAEYHVRPDRMIEPKVELNGTKMLALGGYENISKGSGVIPQAGPILMMLSQMQFQNLSIFGSVAEIGVHHGRFTSFLFVTARKREDLVVADLFEDFQDLNIDLSGSGDKQKFFKGMQTYGLSQRDLHTVFTGSSITIPFDWSRQAGFAPFRLISVDGGHTTSLAFNDLQIAFCNLLPGGIVIIDDFFHGAWPGVTEAFFHFLSNKPEPLARATVFPFLACKSKLFVTNNRRAYQLYYDGLMENANDLVRPFAHEKSRGSVKYELSGIPYLMCKNQIDLTHIHELWASLAF